MGSPVFASLSGYIVDWTRTVTWRLHGGHMAVTWRLHGGYMLDWTPVSFWMASTKLARSARKLATLRDA